MSSNNSFDRGMNRRSFLTAVGLSSTAVGLGLGTTGCSGATSVPADGAGEISDSVLPRYVPVTYAEPDFPSQNESPPGYAKAPEQLVQSVTETPGTGRTINAMTPLWGTIPRTDGNKYFEAVNEMLGSEIRFQIVDAYSYGDKISTVLASPDDVPDWVQILDYMQPPTFASDVLPHVFEDLSPYLSGNAVREYPNLANIPTDAWRMAVWNNKIYAIPKPSAPISNVIFYRDDLFAEMGVDPAVRSGEEFLDLLKEINNPGNNQWAIEDPWDGATLFHSVTNWRLDENGKLLNRVETPEYRAALEWAARAYEAGVVHPDAVAGNKEGAKTRFQSSQSLVMIDGPGGWAEALRDNLAANPSYSQRPFNFFSADGAADPVYWKGNAAGMYSFVKQTDDKEKVKEILRLANAMAAPFGTTEFQLIRFGVEGVHYTLDTDGAPVPTERAARELQPTYQFLADAPAAEFQYQYPGYVEAYCEWAIANGTYLKEPLFYGMHISEPMEYASLGQPFEDLQADIPRGRRSINDLDAAIDQWRASGGDQLRAFYQDILDRG
jgi:putative aldouronate transport system substrate-binding protein